MMSRFTRLASSNVLAQVHVNEDSRFIILPVMERPATITGWLVYETTTGELAMPEPPVEGCRDGIWSYLAEARKWVEDTYYGQVSA